MPAASTSMPMPSYGHVTNLEHHGGAGSQNVEDGPQGHVEAEYGVPVPPRLPPITTFITFIHLYFIVYLLWRLPSNRVISSPFSHRTFFFTKFHEGTYIFFSASKFLYRKWFRCWHGHFRPWLTSKPLFFLSFFR
jgi:hypothetical protein